MVGVGSRRTLLSLLLGVEGVEVRGLDIIPGVLPRPRESGRGQTQAKPNDTARRDGLPRFAKRRRWTWWSATRP